MVTVPLRVTLTCGHGEIRGPARWQWCQDAPFFLDRRSTAPVVLVDFGLDEGAPGLDAREIPAAAATQSLVEAPLEMAVGSLDRTVLMSLTTVVTGGGHAVMSAQILIVTGEIPLRVSIEVLVGGRERIAAMLPGHAAQLPQRVLQMLGQGRKALATQHHGCVFPATTGQAEMVEPMVERLAGDGDVEVVADREIRQALPSGFVMLREENLLLCAM